MDEIIPAYLPALIIEQQAVRVKGESLGAVIPGVQLAGEAIAVLSFFVL